jgi:hypothetical protein
MGHYNLTNHLSFDLVPLKTNQKTN